jgi:MoxR-like ATPase
MNLDPIFKYFHGDRLLIELCVSGLLSRGHVLIEGPPGVGKTRLATLLSHVFGLSTRRVQGTPDLMPGDILGAHILQNGEMIFRKGPVFCQMLQVDEINRITPRTFSALLEVMQEHSVSMRGETLKLDEPFHVLATRSTRESEGVYTMPEAALDRFIISLNLGLPSAENEDKIALTLDEDYDNLRLEGSLQEHQAAAEKIPYSQRLLERAIQISRISREDVDLLMGAGVRGSQALISVARSLSYLRGEEAVTLNSLKDVAYPVMAHRLKPMIHGFSVQDHMSQYLKDSDPAFTLKQRFEGLLT